MNWWNQFWHPSSHSKPSKSPSRTPLIFRGPGKFFVLIFVCLVIVGLEEYFAVSRGIRRASQNKLSPPVAPPAAFQKVDTLFKKYGTKDLNKLEQLIKEEMDREKALEAKAQRAFEAERLHLLAQQQLLQAEARTMQTQISEKQQLIMEKMLLEAAQEQFRLESPLSPSIPVDDL
eukprot:GILI01007727.1.p1 GENE.GILI01007727.1~~GILI01007727.1.p1  ORF type:complete len:175 (+),score=36.44 GILI01007727.1:237-761(+)